MTSTVRIRIVRGDIEFEAEGDEKFVKEMLSRFENVTSIPSGDTLADTSQSAVAPVSGKRLSVREFVQKFGAKRHADKIIAFGYYLEKFLGKIEFTAADINNLYYEAKLETSNTSQAMIGNIRRGLLMEAAGQKKGAGKKRYTLTHSGEQFVEKRLGKE